MSSLILANALLAALLGQAADVTREIRSAETPRRVEILDSLPERMRDWPAGERAALAPVLRRILADPDLGPLHASTVAPLLLTGTEGGVGAVLVRAYAREESALRETARVAIRKDRAPETTRHLRSFLKRDRSGRARAWIALLLGERGGASLSACEALVNALEDESYVVRGAAAEALVRIRGECAGYDRKAWRARLERARPGAPPEGTAEAPAAPASPGETVTRAGPPARPEKRLEELVPRFYEIPLDRKVVVVVLDFSGSVRGRAGQAARQELRRKLSLLPSTRRFTVLAFDERLLRLFDVPAPALPDEKTALESFLRRLPPGKRTELLLPLHVGLGLARVHGRGDAQVLIVSDGAPTVDGPPLRGIVEQARRLRDAGVRVDAAVLGGEVGLFRFLTRETGGSYVNLRR